MSTEKIDVLDCSACKSAQSMARGTVARFDGFIKFIGAVLALPAVFGLIVAGAMVLTGQVTIGLSLAFGCLAGGLVGWLLRTHRNVWRCGKCDFVLDRA
jgi:hypothetical protein